MHLTKNEEQTKVLKQRILEGKCPVCGEKLDTNKCKPVVDANVGDCLVCEHHFVSVKQ